MPIPNKKEKIIKEFLLRAGLSPNEHDVILVTDSNSTQVNLVYLIYEFMEEQD